jgi:hypothetical protein
MKSFLTVASLCLVLVGSAFASTELLYVQEGKNIVTYGVSNTTAVAKKLDSLATNFMPIPAAINRAGSFLYVSGFTSAAQESFNVYSLTTTGVPNPKPIQTLSVKPALSQFWIHPNGKIAYGLFSWKEVVDGKTEYASDIVLFTINPKTGMLTNTTKVMANFPPSAAIKTVTTSGINHKGTELYTDVVYLNDAGVSYYSRAINSTTGALGKPVYMTSDGRKSPYYSFSAFGDTAIVQIYLNTVNSIYVIPNPTSTVKFQPIRCFSTMALECGDSIGPSIWMHPSSAYIFFYDQTTNEVPILYISTTKELLEPSGATIPGQPNPVMFSPDGLLVYAVEGNEILVYVFNPHTGLLTARTSISAPGVGVILPAQ